MKTLKRDKKEQGKPLVPKWLLAATLVGVAVILLPQCGGDNGDTASEDLAPPEVTAPPLSEAENPTERPTWESLGIDPPEEVVEREAELEAAQEAEEREAAEAAREAAAKAAEAETPVTGDPTKGPNPVIRVVPEPEAKDTGGGSFTKAAPDHSPSFWSQMGDAAMSGASMNPIMPYTFSPDSDDSDSNTDGTQTPNAGNSGGVQ